MILPSHQPHVSLSLRPGRLSRIGSLMAAAADTGIGEVDIDLADRRLTRPASVQRLVAQSDAKVRALWLPDRYSSNARRTTTWYPEVVRTLALDFAPQAVMVDRPVDRLDTTQIDLVRELRTVLPAGVALVYVLRPVTLLGTREHLTELTAIRHTAEEWDFGLALDLDGPIDPRWEAEAAITKIRSRLTAVRFGPMLSRPPGRGRERATARVLATLADTLYTGVIAVTPQTPAYRLPTTRALANSCLDTLSVIRRRYALANPPPPDPIPSPDRFPNPTQKDGPNRR